jgi:ketosteroid isomerase-like protein
VGGARPAVRERELIERYFQAMRTGAMSSDEIIDLFADQAVYVEPFSGEASAHVGKDAIRQSFIDSRKNAPPDMTLTLDQVEVDSDCIRSVWTCSSPGFPRPMRGQDLWTIGDGKILRLETSFLQQDLDSDDAQR